MKEKPPLKKTKKSSQSGNWWGPLLILLTLSVVIFLLFVHFSAPDKKRFSVRKINDDKIEIYDLEAKEIDKIDWQKGAIYTEHFFGKKKQYRLEGEGKNFFKRLLGKKALYDFVSELEEHEIRDKEIEFVNSPSKKGIRIPKTTGIIKTDNDLFAEKSVGIKDILQILFWIVSIIASLWIIDMMFGTNFTGIISYPFRGWKKSGKEVSIPEIGFKDVGGLQEAKEELGELDNKLLFNFWAAGSNVDLAKAKGSSETYAIKYMLSKFFLMPVKDEGDPDYRQKEEKDGMTPDERRTVNDFLKKHGLDKKEEEK